MCGILLLVISQHFLHIHPPGQLHIRRPGYCTSPFTPPVECFLHHQYQDRQHRHHGQQQEGGDEGVEGNGTGGVGVTGNERVFVLGSTSFHQTDGVLLEGTVWWIMF